MHASFHTVAVEQNPIGLFRSWTNCLTRILQSVGYIVFNDASVFRTDSMPAYSVSLIPSIIAS